MLHFPLGQTSSVKSTKKLLHILWYSQLFKIPVQYPNTFNRTVILHMLNVI